MAGSPVIHCIAPGPFRPLCKQTARAPIVRVMKSTAAFRGGLAAPHRIATGHAAACSRRATPGGRRLAVAPLAVTPTLQPGLENRNAPSWLAEPLKHVVKSQQFNKEALDHIFKVTREMEEVRQGTDASRQLQGAIMSTLFYEPSTRTRLSFESAMARLGGTILTTESAAEFSSAAKGETLQGGRFTGAAHSAQRSRGLGAAFVVAVTLGQCFTFQRLDHSCLATLDSALAALPPMPARHLPSAHADTIRTVEAYADVVVLRHFQAGSAEKAAAAASIPIINAGDGPGQHPTQVRSEGMQSWISAGWVLG